MGTYTIFSLGDSAATIQLGTEMSEADNQKIMSMHDWFSKHKFAGIRDTIIAYSSLTIFYDPGIILKHRQGFHSAFEFVSQQLEHSFHNSIIEDDEPNSQFRIPVCYDPEFGIDLPAVSEYTKLSVDEIIQIHQSKSYRVYMLGFLPGFAYMGELDAALYMPRKDTPIGVTAGSVGITSNQTGIYPLNSPGGWRIIGRTPISLFDPSRSRPVEMRAGDHIQFYAISKEEFESNRNFIETE